MADLNEMLIFAGVVRHGGFTGAAGALGVPKATVSRKVAELEARLGVRLLQRSTRRVAPTEAGVAFYEHCQRIADEISAAEAAVGRLQAAPRGTLTIGAPFTLGHTVLAPLVPAFLAVHPELRVVLVLSSERADLIERGIDLMVTGRAVPESSYPSRLLVRVPSRLFASPAYLSRRREPRRPEDLAAHELLHLILEERRPRYAWQLTRQGASVRVAFVPAMASNDFLPLLEAAQAGLGVLLAADLSVAAAQAGGQLVPVLSEWEGPPVEVRAVFPSRRALSPKVRAFLDVLVRRVERQRDAGAGGGT